MTEQFSDSWIERRLLEFAFTTDAKITAPSLAYFAPCSIADADRVLDALATHDRLEMEVEADGTVVYHLRGRQRLPARPTPPLQPFRPALSPTMPFTRPVSPMLAGVLSLFLPGAGHLYAGRFLAAFAWFITVTFAYVLLFPGLLLHVFSIASAAASARRLNEAYARGLLGPGDSFAVV